MNTLYWHDYETSGTDPAWDRPLQFAGIRTDEALNVVGEPLNLYCRLTPDVLPHPAAALITGISPQMTAAKGLSEPQFIARIHAELSRPDTCALGYNSIRFDDEITRHTLYRNFFDPYEREWRDGNSRWDIIDTLRVARALRPEGIAWPDHPDGSPSFRLADLADANQLDQRRAHDALSDVYTTIALARLVRAKQPRLYDYLYRHRSKQKVTAVIDRLGHQPFVHVSGRLPRENGYVGLMMLLAPHPDNKNAVIAVNLAADPRPLLDLDSDGIRERVFAAQVQLPEGVERIPLKAIHLNRSPVVLTPNMLDPATAKRLGIDLAACAQHWRLLCGRDLRAKLATVFAAPARPLADAECALYQGFLPAADKPLLARVRAAGGTELTPQKFGFRDPRYAELLFRYRARHYPNSLSPAERERWRSQCYRRLTAAERGGITLDAYRDELARLAADPALTPQQGELLGSLRQWGDRAEQLAAPAR